MSGARAAVLASLAVEPGQSRHGLEVARLAGVSSGSLYPILVRLQRAGLVEARWSAGRRAYRLTGPLPPAAVAERTARTALLWLPAALAALAAAGAALTRPPHVRLSDLAVYTGAVDGLTHGASLYDSLSAGGAPFTYPPFAGLVFLPLAGAPPFALQLGWTLATIAVVAGLALLLDRRGGGLPRTPSS